jgi:hypothetical protein
MGMSGLYRPEVFASHRNARLNLHGRVLLVERVCGQHRPVAHVAKELGISRQCAHRWVARYRAEQYPPAGNPTATRDANIAPGRSTPPPRSLITPSVAGRGQRTFRAGYGAGTEAAAAEGASSRRARGPTTVDVALRTAVRAAARAGPGRPVRASAAASPAHRQAAAPDWALTERATPPRTLCSFSQASPRGNTRGNKQASNHEVRVNDGRTGARQLRLERLACARSGPFLNRAPLARILPGAACCAGSGWWLVGRGPHERGRAGWRGVHRAVLGSAASAG